MSKSKEYYYSAVDGEERLSDASLETPENPTLLATVSKMSWILSVAVVVTSILCGGVIGYNIHRNAPHDSNYFEDTSHLHICEIHLSKLCLLS